jgi:glycopeptide antibiotics resistance protein
LPVKPSTRKTFFALLLGYTIVLLAGCFWPFNFFQDNLVAVRSDGLAFTVPGVAYTEGAAHLEDLTEFTFVTELSAAIPGQASWIISYGLDFDALNFLVGLYVDQLIIETRRGEQTMRASISDALQRGKRTWLVITGAPGLLKVYLDGKLMREITRAQPDATPWNAAYPLVLGARSDGKYPWEGVLHHLAILDTAVSSEEAQDPESLMTASPVVLYSFAGPPSSRISNQGGGDTGPLLVPDRFIPYRRTTLMDFEDLWEPRPVWGDIILNVLAFAPIGILLSLLLRRAFRPLPVLILVLVAAFGLSLSIEMLQIYLPRRWTTFTDVASNSFGALLGGGLWLFGAGRFQGTQAARNRIESSN